MKYFIFYESNIIKSKGWSIANDTIDNWVAEGAKEVSADEYDSVDILNFRSLETARYRLELGVCPHCNTNFKNDKYEYWVYGDGLTAKHICGGCQLGTVPVIQILALKITGAGYILV